MATPSSADMSQSLYLKSLTWDGEARIYMWLADYFGADDTLDTRTFGTCWLYAVTRRMLWGVFPDIPALMLVGPPGTAHKTTAIHLLCRNATAVPLTYAAEHLHEATSVIDAQRHHPRAWIVQTVATNPAAILTDRDQLWAEAAHHVTSRT